MTDPNFVKIGDEYFASEWFDLERIEKMPDFSEFYPGTDPASAADDDSLDWDDIETMECPICGGGNLTYNGELYDDEEHLGSSYECDQCGHHFGENDDDEY